MHSHGHSQGLPSQRLCGPGSLCRVNCELQPLDSDRCLPLEALQDGLSRAHCWERQQSTHSPSDPRHSLKLQSHSYKPGTDQGGLHCTAAPSTSSSPQCTGLCMGGLKNNNSQERERWEMTPGDGKQALAVLLSVQLILNPMPFWGCHIPKWYLSFSNPRICGRMSFKSGSEEVNRRKMPLRG